MPSVIIDNPILNSSYREPSRHFRFDVNGDITNTIDDGRRASSYFLPIAAPKKKGAPGLFDHLPEKMTDSGHVNTIRQRVKLWRDRGWPDVTPITRALLEHWRADGRFRPLFFCQLEALESLVFITEVAKQTKYGDDGRSTADLLNLILEVSGQKKAEKDAKVQTARTLWVRGVNDLGSFGRWAFLEIDGANLHKAKQEIRKVVKGGAG